MFFHATPIVLPSALIIGGLQLLSIGSAASAQEVITLERIGAVRLANPDEMQRMSASRQQADAHTSLGTDTARSRETSPILTQIDSAAN